jgi:site-specific recombinase XerD
MRKTAVLRVAAEEAPTPEVDTEPGREYLTGAEVELIMKHCDGERDRMMVLIAYRHGLRVSELIGMTWRQINLDDAKIQIRRLKGSDDSEHPLSGREVRGLRSLRRKLPVGTRWCFVTSRGGPMTRNGFYKLLEKAAARAGLADVHPHLLRHGTGYYLVNKGMDSLSLANYLGHRQIQNTARYCKMNSARFENLWRD